MPEPSLTLADLMADPARAREVEPEKAAALLIALAPVQMALHLAATAPARTPVSEPVRPPARMLTLKEVAERSGKSVRWWRENWRREIPTATRKGRTVLVPEEDVEKWRRK